MNRQGDLLIRRIKKLPTGLKKRATKIILYGEATGHKHQLTCGSVFDSKEGLVYLSLVKDSQLVHEEHGAIDLKKGKYAVIRQREYQSKDMVRLVVD
jgi:hypothetical protein